MAAVSMTIEGDAAMRRRLESCARDFPLESRRGMNVVLARLFAITQERVPVKSGKLKASGKKSVSLKKVEGEPNIAGTILYGDSEVWYARLVHDNLKAKHPHGQARYVASVIEEAAGTVGHELAKEIDLKKTVPR